MYRFPWGVMVSGNVQHQTGRFYTRGVRVSGLGFPAAPQINMEPNTGDRRVADINLIDARLQKSFQLPANQVRFDVFVDGLRKGSPEYLRSIPKAEVQEIRYLPVQDATTRYGLNVPAGVLDVKIIGR